MNSEALVQVFLNRSTALSDSMKGVSAFVALVLIIVTTLTVAALFSGWFTTFIKSITGTVGEQSTTKIVCSNGGISLSDLEYNQTSGYITGIIQNTEIIDLGDVDVEIFFSNATKLLLDLNLTITPGSQEIFSTNISTSNYERVRVKTNCSNVYDDVDSTYISVIS